MIHRSYSTFISLFLVLSSTTSSTHGLKLPFQRRSTLGATIGSPFSSTRYTFGASVDAEDVDNVNDIRYTTNITINDVEVTVALDTGSTDLWVIPPGGIGQFNDTGIPLELRYGDGSYGVKGTIGVSPFKFGSYQVERQAFMDATVSTISGMQEMGVYGIFGLSFDFSTASPINQKIKSLYGATATWGQSVLQNIFEQHPTQPNFIAIDLSRTDDLEDTDGGSFTIGEYDEKYVAIANATKLVQYPKGGDRWTTLLEGIYVDGSAIEVTSTIRGVPAGHAQALLDTGDPNAILPTAIVDAIYSRVPGAALYSSDTERLWIVPCNTTTHVELAFSGQRYLIHPLDLSTISNPISLDGQEVVACVSAFTAVDGWGGHDYDMSLGDSFLRNVYSVFDFGDSLPDGSTSEPYMQLLSQVDPVKAVTQVATIRGKTMASLPPEIDPATLIQLLGGSSNLPSPPADTGPVTPTEASVPTQVAGSSSEKLALDFATGDNNGPLNIDEAVVKKYALIVICLLAANILIGLILIVFGVMSCIRRGSSRKSTVHASAPHYVPVKEQEEGYSGHYQQPYTQ